MNLRNVFGRFETLEGHASYGLETNFNDSSHISPLTKSKKKTSSSSSVSSSSSGSNGFLGSSPLPKSSGTSYSLTFTQPLLNPLYSSPEQTWSTTIHRSTTSSTHRASHDLLLHGLSFKYSFPSAVYSSWIPGSQSLTLETCWRNVTGLTPYSSLPIRLQPSHSLKTSLFHSLLVSSYPPPLPSLNTPIPIPIFPLIGTCFQSLFELAATGGGIGFVKEEVSLTRTWNFPQWISHHVIFSSSWRSGFTLPISSSFSSSPPSETPLTSSSVLSNASFSPVSHVGDRFHLGGPSSVRGFGIHGLGPRSPRLGSYLNEGNLEENNTKTDGSISSHGNRYRGFMSDKLGWDSLGSDMYWSWGAGVFFPLYRPWAHSLKGHLWFNAGSGALNAQGMINSYCFWGFFFTIGSFQSFSSH